MDRLPKKLNNPYLAEVIYEVRFNLSIDPDFLAGTIYNIIPSDFDKISSYDILDLPKSIRINDPKLKYQPYYFSKKDNLSIKFGPHVLIFSNQFNYSGWSNFFNFIKNIILKMKKQNSIFKSFERIGIRYINFFNEVKFKDIFKYTNIKIYDKNSELDCKNKLLRFEEEDENFIKIIHIANNIEMKAEENISIGSVIDIDCAFKQQQNINEFFNNFEKISREGHYILKKRFFSIINNELLKQLDPIY